jgi:GT2 family glycosyltransferase
MKSVCLAILNFNGRRHLEHLLPSACAAANEYPGDCTVLVLDNCSTDPDVEWIQRSFPSVQVVVAPANEYLFSYNWLAAQRPEDLLVLLNNDVKLLPNFIPPLVRHFEADDVFAVSATSRDWEDQVFTSGPVRLKTHHGCYQWGYERNRQEFCHTFFCSGGFVAVDRKKFLELDGFNPLFWPAYAEDVDLCFRAWRKGWRCLFEPASRVLHRESGTWANNDGGRVPRMCLRNDFLFLWLSLPSAGFWLERAAFYGWTALRLALQGKSWWGKIWLATWFEWRKVRGNYRDLKTSPEELATILARVAEPAASASIFKPYEPNPKETLLFKKP